jgi:hypothetical protein
MGNFDRNGCNLHRESVYDRCLLQVLRVENIVVMERSKKKKPLVKTLNGIEEKIMPFAVLLQRSEVSLAISFTTRVECSNLY